MRLRLALGISVIVALVAGLPYGGLRAQGRQGGPPLVGAGDQAPAPPPTGLIMGRVVDGDTGAPIDDATVTILAGAPPIARGTSAAAPQTPAPPRSVATNGDGEFLFYGLPKGSFPISAAAPGYLRGESGRRVVDDVAEPIALQQDERLAGVVIRMWKYASIAGTLLDENGEPAVGAQVRALHVSMMGDRRRYSQGGTTAVTDDRGRYHLVSLAPGEYVISVPQTTATLPAATIDAYMSPASAGNARSDLIRTISETGAPFPGSQGLRIGDQMLVSSGGRGGPGTVIANGTRLAVAVSVYYPSTTSIADATPITLTSGQNRTGIDLQFHLQAAVSVSGRAIGPTGPAANQGVRLLPANAAALGLDSGFEQAQTATNAAGEFTFPAVPPGQYLLRAARVPRANNVVTSMSFSGGGAVVGVTSSSGASNTLATEPALYAEQPLSVDRDVANVEIRLRPGARVLGKLEFHGSSPQPAPDALMRAQVNLTRADRPGVFIAGTATQVTADGQFTTSQYEPGPYFITAGGALGNYSVESVRRGGQNLDVLPLDLTSGDNGGLVITLTDTPIALTGTVTGPRSANGAVGAGVTGAAETNGFVIAIPANFTEWLAHGTAPRASRGGPVDKQGRYHLSGLAPGEYLVAALTSADNSGLHDVAFFQSIARVGTHVSLNTGESRTVDLTLSEIRR